MAKKTEKTEKSKKYELEALNVVIGGVLYKKEDKPVFDVGGKHQVVKEEVLAAVKAGFLKEKK